MTHRVSRRGDEPSSPDGAGSTQEQNKNGSKTALGRRALLTRGGVVAAGVVGAGAVGAALAGPASAQTGPTTAVDMNTANDAGTSSTVTELDADNNTTPAFIISNIGIDNEIPEGYTTEYAFSGPNLRLAPSPGSSNSSIPNGFAPTPSTVGGDLTATADGNLWFTHDFTQLSPPAIYYATVQTEVTSNTYAQLLSAYRVLDTRTASLRTNIANPSGNLASDGRLLAGHTIAINLDSLVYYAQAMFANVTVTDTAAAGFLTIWSGATSLPNASSINFGAGATLSNFVVSGISEYSTTILNVVGIYAEETTHVILDVGGFAVPGFEYMKQPVEQPVSTSNSSNSRFKAAQAAMLAAQAAKRNASRA